MPAQKVIELLGYSAKEAKVYLAALALGESHISDIAERVKMPRTSVQLIIDKLQKDGLMNFYVMRRYKYWVAENPERILSMMKSREEAVRDALPELLDLRKKNKGRRHIKSQDGGIFRILADTSSQPMLITDEHAQIQYVNSAWEKQFGYNLREVKGENAAMFKSGRTSSKVYSDMWKQLKGGHMFQTGDMIDKRKDGSTFIMRTTIFPVQHGTHTFYIQLLEALAA